MNDVLLILHGVACAALLYSVFCRAVHSCARVRVAIRLAFWLAGMAACIGLVAPLFGWIPDQLTVLFVGVFAAVQATTGYYWRAGVPDAFYKPGCAPRGRRESDRVSTC